MGMAQLIKLENYISRYELDIYRYPGQFIRMKNERWERVKQNQKADCDSSENRGVHAVREKPPEQWKREFAEDVFLFQLRWASSTLKEKSNLDRRYRFDSWLKFFLQQFPDNFLLLYRAVFQIRQVPIELDILLVGPMNLWCITLLESGNGEVFQGESRRFWRKIENDRAVNQLSPLVSNLRMSRLVQQVLTGYDNEPMPMKRIVLSPLAYIEYPDAPRDVEIIDRRNAKQWYEKMMKEPSPLKYSQLKTAAHLLSHCQTESFER